MKRKTTIDKMLLAASLAIRILQDHCDSLQKDVNNLKEANHQMCGCLDWDIRAIQDLRDRLIDLEIDTLKEGKTILKQDDPAREDFLNNR
jgi:FtsZ-binding cell division protein ZapB